MNFVDLCDAFEAAKKSSKSEKLAVFQKLFSKCRGEYSKEHIFSIMRLIVPKQDRERASYNMKEPKIAQILIRMLALPSGNDKTILLKSYLMADQASDFGDVVYSVIRKYLSHRKTTLSVEELNNNLDRIAKCSNMAEGEEILLGLFSKCSADDSRWIIRILLKSMKLGIDDNKILNCYHRDGASYFASNISLRKTVEVLYDCNINLHELSIKIFEAFKPMLSKRVDTVVFKKHFIEHKHFYIENKFDGERFQMHMQNGNLKFFSRNGFDYTQHYGATLEDHDGVFSPKLKNVFYDNVESVILDGEMMLWNKNTHKFGSKGMELDVKKLKESGKYQPCFCVYDMVLLNDVVLTNRPLKERVNLLRRVFKETIPGTILLSEITEISSRQDIVDQLNLVVKNEGEGIIVKDPESLYKYGDRNAGWYKMKLEYFQDTMNDMDLVVMGAQFSSSTSDQLNSFIVGVQSGFTDKGKPIYLSLGKVSSGLKEDDLYMLNEKLKTEGRVFDNQFNSPFLVFGKETPNYYIEPENSLVFVVRATELIRSNDKSYKTSYTLRFPRIVTIRSDKSPSECLTMNELLELTNKNTSVIKMNRKNITLEEIVNIKSRRTKKRTIEVVKFEDTRQISDLFEGYIFYLFNQEKGKSRDDVEALIRRAGGHILYQVNDTVDIVLVGDYNEKAKQLCSKRSHYDVVDLSWIYRVIQDGNLLGYETAEVYCLGNNIKNCLSDELDRYGDSYTKYATIDSLKHSFEIMRNLDEQSCFGQMMKMPNQKSFENYVAYFDKFKIINDDSTEVIYMSLEDELEFRYYRGTVCRQINKRTNLIIMDGRTDRRGLLEDYCRRFNLDCIQIKDRGFIYEDTAQH
ncbi:DNA ligase 4 isoform X2 [Euwallacea fornicatus]|uniref:DNA ligase 4 isoform X2 n=1 Tax=Euwallacea fornicatus TaxID=995702 RepID=UPI00338DCE56